MPGNGSTCLTKHNEEQTKDFLFLRSVATASRVSHTQESKTHRMGRIIINRTNQRSITKEVSQLDEKQNMENMNLVIIMNTKLYKIGNNTKNKISTFTENYK